MVKRYEKQHRKKPKTNQHETKLTFKFENANYVSSLT